MDNEKAIEILSLVATGLSAQHKKFGYDWERQELIDVLEVAIEALRNKDENQTKRCTIKECSYYCPQGYSAKCAICVHNPNAV